MPNHGHDGHLGFMQTENSPQGFLSGNKSKFALHVHVTAKPLKKQYTSHNNMVDYITDRCGNWTIINCMYIFFFIPDDSKTRHDRQAERRAIDV